MLNKFKKICFFLSLIYFSNMTNASLSKQMIFIGQIVSFDQTHVRVKSGNQEYIFSKQELDHPSYVVGSHIELPFDENKMKRAKVKRVKPKKSKSQPV